MSFDVVNSIQKLIEEKIFSKEDEIIYIGDSLTEVGYEFYLKVLLSAKKFFDRYAVLLERAKSKGLISFCEVSP